MKTPAETNRYQMRNPVRHTRVRRARQSARRFGRPFNAVHGVSERPFEPGEDPMTGEDVMVPITETEQLRKQLLQAQRLSSMGALASSVAHEFNNILTTIINYAKIGLRSQGNDKARSEAFEKILKGSQRAAIIVNSMLGFARSNSTQRAAVDLVALVEEVLVLTDKDLSKH